MKKPHDYFCSESLQRDLKGRTVRGGMATGVAQLVKVAIGLGSMSLLARLLGPEDFGLVAMVTFFTGFAGMFVDAGLSNATIQRGEITHRQVSNLFWIATALGTLIALVVAASAPLVSLFYGEPRLAPITLALGVSFVLSGLTVQHQALMRRAMQFHKLAMVDIVSQATAQAVGVFWAWRYYQQPNDYWALVLIPIVVALVRMGLTCAICPWRPGLPSRGAGTRQMVEYGANMTGGQFLNYFARNADNALIGWYWGDAPLGYYANAYRILLFPLSAISGPISNVAVPALSRLKDQPEAYRSFFRRGVELASLVLVPVVAASIALADPLVLTVLGPKWAPSVPLFLALGPAALAQTTAPATVWVYLSWGHTRQWFYLVVVSSIVTVLGFVIALPFGVFWVAVSYSITGCLMRVPNILYAFRPTPLSWRDLVDPMLLPILGSAVASAVAVLVLTTVSISGGEPVRLAVGSVAYALAFFATLFAMPAGRAFLRRSVRLLRSRGAMTPVADPAVPGGMS